MFVSVLCFCRRHTLVLIGATGKLYAFGLGGSGQLGTGKKAMETSPCQVAGNWQPFSKQAANGMLVVECDLCVYRMALPTMTFIACR